jgi:predicted lipoprotein with Yx(FWY)xxD motif
MRHVFALLVAIGLVAFAVGCGEDDSAEPDAAPAAAEGSAPETEEPKSSDEGEEARQDEAPAKKGTTVVLGDSEFGEMLFSTSDQAIYVFERDAEDQSNCYGECATAWPPVLTKGEPVAGDGVDADLLGTTERDDGSTQVTYGGRPLYYYAHEGPGEVLCHNVDLNGGFWWVVGADGEPLA